METLRSKHDLYTEFVRDIYSAEVQEVPALRFFQESASSKDLQNLLHRHTAETRMQLLRLEDLVDYRRESLLNEHCRTMKSMITEARHLVERCEQGPVRDFAITSSLQRLKHCEMLVYRMLIQMADELGFQYESGILDQNLQDEFNMLNSLPPLSKSDEEITTA